jgi:hypothetical protein
MDNDEERKGQGWPMGQQNSLAHLARRGMFVATGFALEGALGWWSKWLIMEKVDIMVRQGGTGDQSLMVTSLTGREG